MQVVIGLDGIAYHGLQAVEGALVSFKVGCDPGLAVEIERAFRYLQEKPQEQFSV